MPSTCLTFRPVKTERTGLTPDFLRELRDRFGLTTFIETGTYQGATTAIAASLFTEVHTIELAEELHGKAVQKFAGQPHVHTHFGDSAQLLPEILKKCSCQKILFWLDGHYSGGATAQGDANTPILAELRALATAGVRDCLVLVDDLRIFQQASEKTHESLTGYPTFAGLRDALKEVFPQLRLAHCGDVAIAGDAASGLAFSPVLAACTASRLYDAEHAPEDPEDVLELFKAEQTIAAATGVEAKSLIELATAYPSAERHGLGGHYHLWAALVLAQQREHAAALKHFNRALELNCRHWRLQCYLAACLDGLGERAEALLALNEARHIVPQHPLLDATHAMVLDAAPEPAPQPPQTCSSGHAADLHTNGELALLKKLIVAESVVFDIGAHSGAWTAAVLEHVRPAQVHLFEPLPELGPTLATRFAKNLSTGQVITNACALSDREETRALHHYEQSPAWSTFHRRTEIEHRQGVPSPKVLSVPTTTLDAYCARAGVRRIHFLKIDVEGGELEVLRGARGLLRAGNIDYLQFEYGGTYADAGTTLQQVFALLKEFGWELFQITPAGLQHRSQFTPALENFQYANYLAAHPRFRALLLGEKPRMLDLAALAEEHHLTPRGVIHIGAHEGKECARYRAMGFTKMLFIEANPTVFAKLQANLRGQPGVLLANVAISDHNGTAKLRVTSMDQSSSLLKLKLHQKIYPDIVETETVEVRTSTLDALLADLSLDPAEFNFLNIDIQGAELLALRGAEKTLRHIEGINTEVNLAELYEGCARLEEVDSHLQRRDFARVALTTPFHPSWGDAFYVRQSVITMSSLGQNGRFANQLFQYAFLKCYGRTHSLRVETPAWIGQKLFGHADPAITRPLPELRERTNLLPEALVPNAPVPFRNVDFWGFFQYNTRYYAPQRDYFRSLFRPTPAVQAHVQPMVERLRRRGKTVVGLHLRRGDYGYEHFFVAPTAWYLDWLRGLWPTLEDPVLFIASDEPDKVLADFAEFKPITAKDLGTPLPGAEFYPDFHLLTQCDALAISNSSFSFAAALLNERATIFARPHLPTAKLIPFNPWNSETLFRDAKVEASSSALIAAAGLQPKFSFVTIVLNGMPFLEYALRAVYDFAHEIILVEGAVENCRFAANPDGSSKDGTVECIKNFPDPQKKIRFIQGVWPEKCEMQNAALAHVTGDYVWLMDSDEVYRHTDLEKVRQLVQADPTITQFNVIPDNFWKGFDHLMVSPRFLEPAAHYRRIFKFAHGARFTSHRPPTMAHPGSKLTTEQLHCISGDRTRALGIAPCHYSYVTEAQVAQKIELYQRYGWGKDWKLDLNEWLRECWQKWTPQNAAVIEKRYPVWTGGRDSRTEAFRGEHPEVMREFIAQWRTSASAPAKARIGGSFSLSPGERAGVRAVVPTEQQALPVIGHEHFLRLTLERWGFLQLDAPLEKRRETILQHLKAGTPFWNNHVGLAFLGERLQPASYLEIGCRTAGSFVQALGADSLREAVAVDLWAGSYSELPNTRDFAASQIEHFLNATGSTRRVELRQGNSHVELKKLIAEGRKFDLINVDGDHTDAGALEDLEDAWQLLNERGAILFDDIIHPGFRSLLGVVQQFTARHPELQLLLNTTQDNGVAVLLRGVTWAELSHQRSADILSARTKPSGQDVRAPRRLKIAGEVATKADLTQIDAKSAFAQAIRKLFAELRPQKIIETGTYLGTGTTQVIAEAIRDLGLKGTTFHSIEVKPQHHQAAQKNLARHGLAKFVTLHHGLSVPRRLLPTLAQIEQQTVRHVEGDDLFIDHQEHERAALYFKETEFANVPDDLLGECLRQWEGRPDFVLLDSAGHLGHIEFQHLLSQLATPCVIALDDIHHIKHHRSFRQMQADARFEILVSSREKFGFCIAKFTPVADSPAVQRLLWVRTDAIGDAALASSMLPHVRAKYPEAKIAVLCREALAPFYLACPHLDTIIGFDWTKASQDEAYRQTIISEISGFAPDLVLNSTYSREPVTELLALSQRGARVIGLEGNLSNISAADKQSLDQHYNQLIPSPGAHKLELERHRDFLAGLGVATTKLEPQVWTSPDDEALAEGFFQRENLDPAHTIALFPGAQNDRRIYPHYAEALRPFSGYTFLIFGDAQTEYLAAEHSAQLPGISYNLAGKTSLGETAALLRRSRLYVGAESAGAHFACALGVPNVVILGGGHYGRFMPYSPLTSAALLPLDCFSCDWRCRHAKPHCVKDIAPEVITEAVRQTLNSASTKTRLFVQGSSLWKPGTGEPKLGPFDHLLAPGEYEVTCVESRKAVVTSPKTPAAPLVSAIVSTYNSERFLRGCLEDLEAQTIADRLEIIVVDSGSTQNERAIVEEFQQRFSNIVYLRTERESLYAAWNRAIAIAHGRYLTNANTDDRHRPDAYELLARALDEHPVGIVYADSWQTTVENETFATTQSRRAFGWPEFSLKELVLRNYFGPHPMWRRSVHETVGLFNPDYAIAGDYDFNLRVAAKFGACRVEGVLGLYLEGGLESRHREQCVRETRQLLHHHRRQIPVEDIQPALREPGFSAQARAKLLVEYAVALTTTWHPDKELAQKFYQQAFQLAPEFVQGLEKSQGAEVSTKVVQESASSRQRRPEELRLPGYSFCIITHGQRAEKLRQQIASIRALNIPAFEILVGGEVPAGLDKDILIVPVPDAARNGRLGEMRNRLVERARFDHLVVSDDDMLFHADFYTGLQQFGEDYDLLCSRLLNPDGTRFWDWATVGGPRGQTILDYDEVDPFTYITGGLCVMKASVATRVQWDEGRGFYQAEDLDFSRRLQRAGFTLKFNRHSTVTHNDARYTLDGPVVVRVEGALQLARQDYEEGRTALARHRLERALRLWPCGETTSAALKLAREFRDGAAVPPLVVAPRRSPVMAGISDFALKFPVRWVAPIFGSEAKSFAAALQPFASRLWLGALHHGGDYLENTVLALAEPERELLFALADRFPAMLGGVAVSQLPPEKFVKLPGAVCQVGFLPENVLKLTREQAACCEQMDEIWASSRAQANACIASGVAQRKVVVVANAEEIFARLKVIEQSVLANAAQERGPLVRLEPPPARKPGPNALDARTSNADETSALPPLRVAWEGSFLDLGSLSLVNRELTHALLTQPKVEVTCVGRNVIPKELAAMPDLRTMAGRLRAQLPKPPEVTVRHAWPPNWEAPKAGAWVLIQPWEFGSLPAAWLAPLARVDEVWVPSEFVRRCYVESGIESAKVHVVPNGIDPERFRPAAPPLKLATKKSFKFLFVGGTIHRKGPDLLLKAFLESFTAADDVCLVIKDFGGQSCYAGQTFAAQIIAARQRPDAPEILYLTDDMLAEDLPGLYTACDCLVHPYRGEGFGLPVLEAMACALPVIVTGGGSTDDFATEALAYQLPAQRQEFGTSVSGMQLVKPGWLLEPDFAALVERMKWIVTHRDEARARGRLASEHVRREWTWERAAQVAAWRLQEIQHRRKKRGLPGRSSTAPHQQATRAPVHPIELPACAKVGHLGVARELFQHGKLLPAWQSTVAAWQARPFHPEAILLLAAIARAAGDPKRAKCLENYARKIAPKCKPAKASTQRTGARVDLPELPHGFGLTTTVPRLTVCLITKNEERFIGQCLESIRPIADQIVLVDTGSTDWTTTIAGRFGAEIHKFTWCDDFSAARNTALEKATGDWILFLDADEELTPDQHEALRAHLHDTTTMAFRLPLLDAGREDDGVSYVPRLFRNAPGLFYVGRVHEQVFSSIEVRRAEWGLENKLGAAKLLHHGYTKELVQSRDKIARNLRLLELAIEELPGEPNLLMNLGLELVRAERVEEGRARYAEAFAAMSALPKEQVVPELRESLLTQFCSQLLPAKQFTEIIRVLTSPIAQAGGLTASMHWLLGLAQMESKRFAEGAEQMRQCLAKRKQPALAPVLKDVRKAGPHHCLALCLAALKETAAAGQAFQAALAEEPEQRRVRFDYARLLADTGQEVEALKRAHQLVTEDASEALMWQFGGQVALRKPEFLEFACDWTSEAIKLHATHPAIIEQRATALLLSGQVKEALPLWRSLSSESALAARLLCEAVVDGPLSRVSPVATARVSQEFVNWYRRLLKCQAANIVMAVNERLDALREVVPAAVELIQAAVAEAA